MLAGGLVALAAALLILHGGGAHASATTTSPASHSAGSSRPAQHAARRQVTPALEARIDRATAGRLTTVHFYSPALGKAAAYIVYLPAGYTPMQPLPVFYLLHGIPGKPIAFTVNAKIEVRLEDLIRARRVSPMILVFPDGRIDGRTSTDSEWANTPSRRYESYITDVVHDVDHRFATIPNRQERAIAGLSAGAYGAANVGLHQDRTFGLVQVWSGYFLETHNGVFANAAPSVMAYNSRSTTCARCAGLSSATRCASSSTADATTPTPPRSHRWPRHSKTKGPE